MSDPRPDPSPDDRRMLHPELTAEERRRLFHQGIELFNTGRFYDCHEAFEEIWRSTTPEPRDLFQGLIQVAVGLHHYLENGNASAGRRVLRRGMARLRPLGGVCCGLDVAGLLEEAARWERFLGEPKGEPPGVPRVLVVEEAAVL